MTRTTRSIYAVAVLFIIVQALFSALTPVPLGATIAYQSGDLMDAIETVRDNMPGSGEEGFVVPSSEDLDIWRVLSEALLNGEPTVVDSLVGEYLPFYELIHFTDTGFENRQYYILRESLPVTQGWGTFILNSQYQREIAIEVPHALFEINTPSEGTDMFRRTGARLFIMAGTHRCSNRAITPCDGSTTVCNDTKYHVSDMGHFVDAPYQVTHEVFTDLYPQGYSFSIHGTGRSECNDIFLSNGTGSDSKPILYALKNHMNASGNIIVSVAGDGSSTCALTGATNVQGRHTNGSYDPCRVPAVASSGYFIHAEQQRRVRDDFSIYLKFINAINETIETVVTGVSNPPGTRMLSLSPAHPNPFETQTRFTLSAIEAQDVTVDVIDVAGHRIVLLLDGFVQENESLNLSFHSRGLPSGVYFIRAAGKGITVTRKITLLR